MVTLNKVEIASQMFVEAHERYISASQDFDYVASIVFSGAVMGIVSPLLKEQGGHTSHSLLARIGNLAADPGDPSMHEGIFRATYNAFKHAGKKSPRIAPSADLEVTTDLKREAAQMLDPAKDDFRQIQVEPDLRARLSPQFIALLESYEAYA